MGVICIAERSVTVLPDVVGEAKNSVFVKDRCSVVLMEQVIYDQTKIKDSYITFIYSKMWQQF